MFLELEERSEIGDFTNAVNSLSVYEFDDAGKLRHLDVYLQMEVPGAAIPCQLSSIVCVTGRPGWMRLGLMGLSSTTGKS